MPVLVMHVGDMRVRMAQAAMLVRMRMRLAGRVAGLVRVPMMLVMHVGVRMGGRLVHVLMLVVFGQMQPHADRHQHARRRRAAR